MGDEADSPRGRIQLIRTVIASPAAPSETTVGHLEACLVCRACETACPSGVPFGRIMEAAREVLREREDGGAFARRALDTVARPRRLALAARLADLGARLGLARLAAKLPGRIGWAASLAAPAEGAPFRGVEREGADVSIFAGCIMRESFGDTERATVRLLERDGQVVSVPEEQTCCGALHAHAGDGERAVKARTRRAIRVVYQDACHLAHGQRIRAQPRALLRAIEGLVLIDIEDAERCCGSAGIYNLTHPEVSRELQQDKVRKILDASPDVIVSANPGCMLQIAAGLRAARSSARVVHLARFLDDPDLVVAGDP